MHSPSTLKDIGKIDQYQTTTIHNKAWTIYNSLDVLYNNPNRGLIMSGLYNKLTKW